MCAVPLLQSSFSSCCSLRPERSFLSAPLSWLTSTQLPPPSACHPVRAASPGLLADPLKHLHFSVSLTATEDNECSLNKLFNTFCLARRQVPEEEGLRTAVHTKQDQHSLGPNLALPLACCVTLGRSFNSSSPYLIFLFCKMGILILPTS